MRERQSDLTQGSRTEIGRSDLSNRQAFSSNPVHLIPAAINQRINPEIF